jgi:hypothetical protein
MTQDVQSEGKQVVERRFRKFEKLHSQKGEPVIASATKPQAGGQSLYDELGLSHIPRNWVAYCDGALRSNEGSMSDLVEPPGELYALWCRISEYRQIKAHYAKEHHAALYLRLKQQVSLLMSPPTGPDQFHADVTEDDIAELKQAKEFADLLRKKFKSAQRMVNKYRDKTPSPSKVVQRETMRLAERALQQIEELAPKGPVRYLPDPAKSNYPTVISRFETTYPDPTRSVLTANQADYDDPRRVRLDGNGSRRPVRNPLDGI